jgi:hypothetical protein
MPEAKKVKDLKSKLDDFKDGLNRRLLVDNRIIILSIEDQITRLGAYVILLIFTPLSEIHMIESQTKDQHLLDKIRVPERSNIEIEARLCHEGTRSKVLQDMEDWLAHHNESTHINSLLWLNGQPGAGKSAVANSLRKRLIDKGHNVISFGFNQNSRIDATARVLWQSIAYQLADQFAGPRKVILDALRDEKSAKSLELLTSKETFDIFVAKAAESVREIPLDLSPIIIVDALDECGGDLGKPPSGRRTDLLATLNEWVKLPSNCKLIVTSRDEMDIRNVLSRISMEVVLQAGSNVDNDSMADVRQYIQKRLERHGKREPTSGRRLPWPSPVDVEALVQRAAGLFIWAKTACDFIESGEVRSRMKELLESSNHGAEMSELYAMTLNRAFTSNTTEVEQYAISTITGTMIASSIPLSLETIVALNNIDNTSRQITDDNADYVIKQLHSVLAGDKIPQFAHLSFPDFLQSSTCPNSYHIVGKLQHRRLALCTLKVLSQLQFNMCKLETSHLLNDDIPDFTERVEAKFPLGSSLSYACQFWVDHLVQSDCDDELRNVLWDFLRQKTLFWLEAMSLLKKTGEASRMLASFVKWSNDSVCTILNSSCTFERLTIMIAGVRPRFDIVCIRCAQVCAVCCECYVAIYAPSVPVFLTLCSVGVCSCTDLPKALPRDIIC